MLYLKFTKTEKQKGTNIQIVTLSFYRFNSFLTRFWALSMMGRARFSLSRIRGLEFWKLCGSGTGEGFTPRPNTSVYAILCVWKSLEIAQEAQKKEKLFKKYQTLSIENWNVYLGTISSRGKWSGKEPFFPNHDYTAGPIAALTRATIKPSKILRFWKREPEISKLIGSNNDVLFKIGIGELPFLQQITFSVWPNTDCMSSFARREGPHASAIKAVREGDWFKEELYARFKILQSNGDWNGNSSILDRDII